MKFVPLILLAGGLFVNAADAPGAAKPLYTQDFEKAEVDKVPDGMLVLDGGFADELARVLAVLPARRQNLLFSATFSSEIKALADSLLNAPAMIDTVGGQVQLFFGAIGPMLPYIGSGRLRALGVSSAKRSPLLPEVPAIAETLPGYEAGLFIAMVAPVATPREIIVRMHAEIARIMQAPDMKTRLAQLGDEIAVSATPEQFTAFLKTEFAKWDRIIKEAGIKVE